MAVDNRPFKSKEQDGQGNEVIIRDQQLVEQGTATTMASGACFETRDVDDRPVKIPRDNMMNIVLECIGIILNDSSRNLGTNVQKALGLQGNTVGHSTVADFASVLGVPFKKYTSATGDLSNLTGTGIYVGSFNEVSGYPQGENQYSYFLLVVFNWWRGVGQILFSIGLSKGDNCGGCYLRAINVNASTVGPWKEIQ